MCFSGLVGHVVAWPSVKKICFWPSEWPVVNVFDSGLVRVGLDM